MAADSAPTREVPVVPASPNQLWFLNQRSALLNAVALSGGGFVTKDVASELIGTIKREEEKASELASD